MTGFIVLYIFRPFSGKYLRQKDEGVYTCVVCDNQLFRSDQKYETMCGWPSFYDVIAHGKVTVSKDTTHGKYTKVMGSSSSFGSHPPYLPPIIFPSVKTFSELSERCLLGLQVSNPSPFLLLPTQGRPRRFPN